MRGARLLGPCVTVLVACAACGRTGDAPRDVPSAAIDTQATADSIPEERPDTVQAAPPDSATRLLALLPAPASTPLDGEAAALADRAVFAPLTQRWFMARVVDSVLAMDVGRVDGGVGSSDQARAAFARMVAARSPLQRGMPVTVHTRSGAALAQVTDFRVSGRRIVALLDAAVPDSSQRAVPVEWRGNPPRPLRSAAATACAPGDTAAIAAAIARYLPMPRTAVSVLRGCFGGFRALVSIRPLDISPDSTERVVLVRENGGTRSGRLRDLSYPLHDLRSVLDIDGDGVDEIVVHSFRMSMDTWAALRMTDSVTFARFASGFTVEYR